MLALLRCALLGMQGRWSEALAPARQFAALEEDLYLFSAGLPIWRVVEALGRAGEHRSAGRLAELFGRGADGSPRLDLTRQHMLAALARTQGAQAQAGAYLSAASTLAERLGLLGEQWLIAAEQAALYTATGDMTSAATAADPAAGLRAALAERLGDAALRAGFLKWDIRTVIRPD